MDVLLDKGEQDSGPLNINFVGQFKNIYVIDNHLVAFWCWLQLPDNCKYNLLHIDQHYDLAPYCEAIHSAILKYNWTNITLEELTTLKSDPQKKYSQIIRWDNYINLFAEIKPNFFHEATFITEKQGSFNYDGRYIEKELYEKAGWSIRPSENVILNLDLDYFFTKKSGAIIQKYTDKYVHSIADWVYEESQNFAQIIFCLSPECCISWTESKRIANIFLNKFNEKI